MGPEEGNVEGAEVSVGSHGWPEKAVPRRAGWVLGRRCARPQAMVAWVQAG